MQHRPPLVPAHAEQLYHRLRFLQPQPLDRRLHRLLDHLRQRHLESTDAGLGFGWLKPAWLRRYRPPPFIEMDFCRRFGDGLDLPHAILRMPHFHADMQGFDLHALYLTTDAPAGEIRNPRQGGKCQQYSYHSNDTSPGRVGWRRAASVREA